VKTNQLRSSQFSVGSAGVTVLPALLILVKEKGARI
jgi:hypothetical protein